MFTKKKIILISSSRPILCFFFQTQWSSWNVFYLMLASCLLSSIILVLTLIKIKWLLPYKPLCFIVDQRIQESKLSVALTELKAQRNESRTFRVFFWWKIKIYLHNYFNPNMLMEGRGSHVAHLSLDPPWFILYM